MEVVVLTALVLIGLGVIIFFVLASRRTYRRHAAIAHYTKARDELSKKDKPEEAAEEEEEEEGAEQDGLGFLFKLLPGLIAFIIAVVFVWPAITELTAEVGALNTSGMDIVGIEAARTMSDMLPIFLILGVLIPVVFAGFSRV